MAGSSKRLKPSLLPIEENCQVKVCDTFAPSLHVADSLEPSHVKLAGDQLASTQQSRPSRKGKHLKSLSTPLLKLKEAFVELMVSPKGSRSPHSMGMVMGVVDFGGYEAVSTILARDSKQTLR